MADKQRIEMLAKDFKLVRTSDGLWIESLDYHAQPLFLGLDELRELGLVVAEPGVGRRRKSEDRKQRRDRPEV